MTVNAAVNIQKYNYTKIISYHASNNVAITANLNKNIFTLIVNHDSRR